MKTSLELAGIALLFAASVFVGVSVAVNVFPVQVSDESARTGQLISIDHAITYTSVSASTTRKQALPGNGSRQYARCENQGTLTIYYRFTNTSSSMSTSTAWSVAAGSSFEIKSESNLWPGEVWILANTSTPQALVCGDTP